MRDILASTLKHRYHIERELGKGGMGAVYLAQDLALQRPVAIKVLPPELAVRPELRERFLRETRMAAGFSHPHIVSVHAVEDHPHLLAFVMAFVEGETLGQRVRRAGPLGATEAVRMLQEVAWALSYAHGRQVVHRDIKPDNILIERSTGRVLVTDFGIARSTAAAGNTNALTQLGELVGTPQYMSPEQAAGEPVDGRSDIYSLGVVGFYAVTGRLPFEADNAGALMAMHLTQAPPRAGSLRPDLPHALTSAIDRCLEKNPAARFENGESLAAALDPLRSARREIAPALRVFHSQVSSVTRVAWVVFLFTLWMMLTTKSGGDLDHLIFVVIGLAVLWGFAAQLTGRARYLQRNGFHFDEVSESIRRVLAERDEARAEERSDPIARMKERRRIWMMLASFVYGLGGATFVFKTFRHQIGPQLYATSRPGVIILASCALSFGIGLALMMMNSSRATGVDKIVGKLWTGAVGRLVFRIAAWRLGTTPNVANSSTNLTAGPSTLVAALPVAMRKSLGNARQQIDQFELALAALGERQRSIEGALGEAGSATPSPDPAMESRRAELLYDLTRAREEAAAKRERLAGALENVRLQLLRLKSGIGSAADVAQELRAAEGVAS